jgi:hypothetical protein
LSTCFPAVFTVFTPCSQHTSLVLAPTKSSA